MDGALLDGHRIMILNLSMVWLLYWECKLASLVQWSVLFYLLNVVVAIITLVNARIVVGFYVWFPSGLIDRFGSSCYIYKNEIIKQIFYILK